MFSKNSNSPQPQVFILLIVVLAVSIANVKCIVISINEQPTIISISKNITVEANDTVQLPCVVKQNENTIAIWQQCEDVSCNELRSPVTIGRENFIQDLRFRLLHNNENENDNDTSVSNDNKLMNWMLEIRRFTKNDEACYECQLNTLKMNKIHYCVKLKPKVFISSKKLTLKSNQALKLECYVNSIIHLNRIRWYKNNVKLHDHNHDSSSSIHIDRKHFDDKTYTTLTLSQVNQTTNGVYMCKYENGINETAEVNIVDTFVKTGGNIFRTSYSILQNGSTSKISVNFLFIFIINLLFIVTYTTKFF